MSSELIWKIADGFKKLSPQWIVALIFMLAISIGTILLILPFSSTAQGSLSLLDALFTATSALCVTGLTVLDIGSELTLFGQIVVLTLIQLGGLGIMTIGTFLLVIIGQRLSMQSENVLLNTLGTGESGSLYIVIKSIITFTLIFEGIGTLLLWFCYLNPPDVYADLMGNGIAKPLYYALFHAISAFCNAGFSLHSNSLVYFRESPLYMLTAALLIVAGGIGFMVAYNLAGVRFRQHNLIKKVRVKLHTRLALSCTAFLIVAGTLLLLLLEWNNTLAEIPQTHNRFITAFFQAVTPRTAGFNAVPMNEINSLSRFITNLLMFIGGSPGSAAGGIKTTTFVVLLMTIVAFCKGRSSTIVANRYVHDRIVRESIVIFLLFLFGILTAYGVLLFTENPATTIEASNLFFETVSAFATVGLSMDTTTSLSNTGRLIIIVCMYVGRLGPMTVALLIGNRQIAESIHYPEENVVVG
jgi:trk system potassium uptake protein